VFFSCNGCGETLKKNKVDGHSYSCRQCISVSCIDCNVNFTGDEYKKHLTCVSEAQRYQGALYNASEKENKGALKQGSWMDNVRAAAEEVSGNAALKNLLVRISDNDNVPRKRAKFLNFIKNSMRIHNQRIVEQAWEAIEAKNKPPEPPVVAPVEPVSILKKESDPLESDENEEDVKTNGNLKISKKEKKNSKKNKLAALSLEETAPAATNGNVENGKKEKKNKKRKREEQNESAVVETKTKKKKSKGVEEEPLQPNLNLINGIAPDTPCKGKFKISSCVQKLLLDKDELPLKKVKRKVIGEYLENYPHKTAEQANSLFDKKIMKIPGVAVGQGLVRKETFEVED